MGGWPPPTYYLSGGSLWAKDQVISGGIPGNFNQSGGTNTAGSSLNVGSYELSGTYKLSGGSLSAQYLNIGASNFSNYTGTGDFIQSGGTNTVSGSLNVGYIDRNLIPNSWIPSEMPSRGAGAYTQTGGLLEAPAQYVGYMGTGIFNQSGGENKVSGDLVLGDTFIFWHTSNSDHKVLSGSGTYNLSGGSLSANNQYICNYGTGIFNQSGGTNTVSGSLYVGYNIDYYSYTIGRGTYNLSGGSLSAHELYIGGVGTGTFKQSGGTNTVDDLGVFCRDERSTYELSDGSLSTKVVFIVGGFFTQSGGSHTGFDLWLEGKDQYYSYFSGAYNLQGGSLSATTITVNYGAIFNQTGGSLNAATFNLQGGEVQGSLENRGVFNYLSGAFSGRLRNYGAADLYAGGNAGFTAGDGLANYAPLTIPLGKTLTLNGAGLDNQSTLTLAGGALGGSGPLVNNATGTLSGHGAINAAGGLTNAGTMTLTGGNTTVQGEVTNAGTVRTTNANVTWAGTFTNSGAYISDPSTQTFTDLIITSTGYLQGGMGDKWSISGNFQNESTQNTLWKTALSDLAFTGGGTHQLYIPGADLGLAGYTNNFAWGRLDITGQSLDLMDGNATPGGAQYVGEILGVLFSGSLVTNIAGNGLLDIYYNPNLLGNAYLGGLTYDLSGGGRLIPTPLPPSAWLFLSGLAGLGLLGRRGKEKKG